ncbi:alpha/beta fold hydrolase [Opitutus sp. ER46]|uniref:alpha/beta hydrolase n=1 Tax=Opitutus sp. ER46 TaxID=2161864 RepID=UPI000D2F5F65|nr:alpha/beta fold hydrolase [Opitutus sp. ER46]PTX98512.1 alpha/beta hydrolase [Opitutus sp. ER46]
MLLRRISIGLGGLFLVLAVVFFAGPRPDTRFHPRPLALEADLDLTVAKEEARFTDIVPGAEKKIIWANAAHTRTPVALVYLHGFTATRQETAPLSDRVAARLGANLFYTRFTGHGRPGEALGDATVNDWLNDGIEALEIGRRLGERVVVIGTSTGGTVATWLALERPDAISACVLVSPNFGPSDGRANLLTLPWASEFAPPIFGATRHRLPKTAEESKYWTTTYPTRALIPMMALVTMVKRAPLEELRVPMLVVYSPEDRVVDPKETERVLTRIGRAPVKTVLFAGRPGSNHHVLAGDIAAPENTAELEQLVFEYLSRLSLTPATPGAKP